MVGKHVALLVEDDLVLAGQLGELLESFGHAFKHVTNQHEAVATIKAGDFCYVLLDLQIKVKPDAISPHVTAGHALLENIRDLYPAKNRDRWHLLPVIIVSGHAKEHEHVVRAMRSGADDFLSKSLDENQLRDKIEQALRNSGRFRHERCADLMRDARAERDLSRGGVRIDITAVPSALRHEVLVDGKVVALTTRSLAVLVELSAARQRDPHAWVETSTLGRSAEEASKAISRLKQELRPYLPLGIDALEKMRRHYRLAERVELGPIDVTRLQAIDEPRINAVLKLLKNG